MLLLNKTNLTRVIGHM